MYLNDKNEAKRGNTDPFSQGGSALSVSSNFPRYQTKLRRLVVDGPDVVSADAAGTPFNPDELNLPYKFTYDCSLHQGITLQSMNEFLKADRMLEEQMKTDSSYTGPLFDHSIEDWQQGFIQSWIEIPELWKFDKQYGWPRITNAGGEAARNVHSIIQLGTEKYWNDIKFYDEQKFTKFFVNYQLLFQGTFSMYYAICSTVDLENRDVPPVGPGFIMHGPQYGQDISKPRNFFKFFSTFGLSQNGK